jgi:hypothetical protein
VLFVFWFFNHRAKPGDGSDADPGSKPS